MSVGKFNVSISSINIELGLLAEQVDNFDELFNLAIINEDGLDPVYCASLASLQTKPYEIGKWRNYKHEQAATSALKGRVTSAITGLALNNVVITPTKNGQSPVTGITNSAGYYFLWLAPGEYTVTYVISGYITHIATINIPAETEVSYEVSLTPNFTGSRFVLNWGASPTDYDLHLHLPFVWNSGTPLPNTVYWAFKGNVDSIPWATLDHDITTGYGPETISIHTPKTGSYGLYVKRYSNTQIDLVGSGARVTIYNETQSLIIYIDEATIISPGTPFQNTFWYICDIDGATKQVTVVNEIRSANPF